MGMKKEEKKIISAYMSDLGRKSWKKNKKVRDMAAIGALGGAKGKGKLRGKYKKHAMQQSTPVTGAHPEPPRSSSSQIS